MQTPHNTLHAKHVPADIRDLPEYLGCNGSLYAVADALREHIGSVEEWAGVIAYANGPRHPDVIHCSSLAEELELLLERVNHEIADIEIDEAARGIQ